MAIDHKLAESISALIAAAREDAAATERRRVLGLIRQYMQISRNVSARPFVRAVERGDPVEPIG